MRPKKELKPFSELVERTPQGKLRLNSEGRWRFQELKMAQESREFARQKRLRVRAFFTKSKPLKLKTSNGFNVLLVRDGFENVYKESTGSPARAMVVTLVNGERLYFYRSSGDASKTPGEWFPTHGPVIQHVMAPLDWMHKAVGHPNPEKNQPEHFPSWVNEVRRFIKANEEKLVLHKSWGKDKYLQLTTDLSNITFTKHLPMKDIPWEYD